MRSKRTFWIITLALIGLVFTLSCGEPIDRYVGKYEAEDAEQGHVSVELNKNGKGIRKVGDDEVTFRWDVREGKMRVHAKSGGIITGEIEGDTLHVAMPGGKKMSFKKTE